MRTNLDENDVNMSFRIPKSLRDEIRQRADALDINVSELLRNALRDELRKPLTIVAPKVEDENEPMKHVNFFCPANLYETFARACAVQNASMASVIRSFMYSYIHKDNK